MITIVNILATIGALQSTTPAVSLHAKAVIDQRSRMPNRYSLKVRVETQTPKATPPYERETSLTYHVWQDGDKFRVDGLDGQFSPPRPTQDSNIRHVTCLNCEREGFGIVTTVLANPRPPLHVVGFHRLESRNFDYGCTRFDWRYFGLCNVGKCAYTQKHVAMDFTNFFMRSNIVTRQDKRNGTPCLAATAKTTGSDQSVWLSEHDGYNPVLFADHLVFNGVPEDRTTEVSWQKTPGGHYFPKTVKHNAIVFQDGQRRAQEEIITITHADFDSPIDPAVFTLAGLGLNENQVVGFPDLETADYPYWRNGKVDYDYTLRKRMNETANERPAVPAAASYPGRGNAGLVLSITAGMLAILAAVAAIFIRRRRAKA